MKIPVWILNQFKKKSRIYIFPTRMGGYLNGLIFLMFLLAVGYNNNLLLIFTLLLFSFNLLWVIQTHFYLNSLKIDKINLENGHACEFLSTTIDWKKIPDAPYDWELSLEKSDGSSYKVKSLFHQNQISSGSIVLPKRGMFKFDHLCIKTSRPFGLYKVWIYHKIDLSVFVFPEKLKSVPNFDKDDSFLNGENLSLLKGSHDIWNLSPYQGLESRKISWKQYARSGELVVKEGNELTRSLARFKLNEVDKTNERILSKLATQMIFCQRTDVAFVLEIPGKRLGPDSSSKFLIDCLKELTLC